MASFLSNLGKAAMTFLLFIVSIVVALLATMEIIFAPMLTIRYYVPGLLHHHAHQDWSITFLYVLCIIIQVFNFAASITLFVSLFMTGYSEKWLGYDSFTLVSVSLSLSILVHNTAMNVDLYETNIEKDIYLRVSSVGDLKCNSKMCFNTDVFAWHQSTQCCGWNKPEDLLGSLSTDNLEVVATNNANQSQLPQFCCFNIQMLTSKPCSVDSLNRFAAPCSQYRAPFFMLRSISFMSHPCHTSYTLTKMVMALIYTFTKKYAILPQSEGLYSQYIVP